MTVKPPTPEKYSKNSGSKNLIVLLIKVKPDLRDEQQIYYSKMGAIALGDKNIDEQKP